MVIVVCHRNYQNNKQMYNISNVVCTTWGCKQYIYGWEGGSEKRKTDYPTCNTQLDISWRKMLTGKEMMKEIKGHVAKALVFTRNGHYHPRWARRTHTGREWQVKCEMEEASGSADRSYLSDFYHPWNPEKIVARVWEQGLSGCHRSLETLVQPLQRLGN